MAKNACRSTSRRYRSSSTNARPPRPSSRRSFWIRHVAAAGRRTCDIPLLRIGRPIPWSRRSRLMWLHQGGVHMRHSRSISGISTAPTPPRSSMPGAGGVSEVYRACAMPGSTATSGSRSSRGTCRPIPRLGRFEQEAKAVAALSHANTLARVSSGVLCWSTGGSSPGVGCGAAVVGSLSRVNGGLAIVVRTSPRSGYRRSR